MSQEYQQIVALANTLSREEILSLMVLLSRLQEGMENDEGPELSEADRAEIHNRFQMIDQGTTDLHKWDDVKQRVFGK